MYISCVIEQVGLLFHYHRHCLFSTLYVLRAQCVVIVCFVRYMFYVPNVLLSNI